MKGLQKLALASAIAAAPFATQAMEPMSDSQMGNVTGQQGVTIELSTAMTIDQIEYSQDTNGSFLMDGIRVGGFDAGETLDLSVDIDLQDSGDAVIDVGTLDGAPVALGVDADSMGIEGDAGSATLISDLAMDMFLTELEITAQVEDLNGDVDTTGSLDISTQFAIDHLNVDFDVAAISLQGMRMGGANTMDALKNTERGGDYLLDTGAGAPNDLTGSPAVVNMTIGAGDSLSGNHPGAGNDQDVLRVNVDSFQADIWMPTINVGQQSIGSVAISNMQVQDTQIAVYGRD